MSIASVNSREWAEGWRLALAGCGGLFTVVLYVYSMGLFIEPLQAEFGWSRAEISSGMLIVGLIAVAGNPLIGLLLDRFGPAGIALLGVVAHASALAALSLVSSDIQSWWIAWVFVGVTAVLVCVPVWDISVMRHFQQSRGLAIACVYAGSSLNAFCIPYVMTKLVDAFGWRGGYVGLATIALVVGLISALLLRSVPISRSPPAQAEHRAGQQHSWQVVLTSSRFWRVAAAAILVTLCVISLTVYFVPLAGERSVPREQAALLAGLIGVAGFAGRFGTGLLLDRFHAGRVGAVIFCIPATACLLLALGANGPLALTGLAIAIGVALGAELDIMAYLCSRYFRPVHYGFAMGVLTGLVGGASGAGPLMAGLLRDSASSYDVLLLLVAGVFVISALLTLSLGAYPTRLETTPVHPT